MRVGWETLLDGQLGRLEKQLNKWLISSFNLASAMKTDPKNKFCQYSEKDFLGPVTLDIM